MTIGFVASDDTTEPSHQEWFANWGNEMKTVDNTVDSVIGRRSPVVLCPTQAVREAAQILCSQIIGAAPFLKGYRLVGIFTERDVLRMVVAAGRDADATRVADVMTPDPRAVTAGDSLVNAFAIMIAGNFRHLPVVGGEGRLIAVLSMGDVPPEHRIMHRQWTEWTDGKTAAEARA
jgi:CBS domain-containing protein